MTKKKCLLEVIIKKGGCVCIIACTRECPKECTILQAQSDSNELRYEKAVNLYIEQYGKEDLIAELI